MTGAFIAQAVPLSGMSVLVTRPEGAADALIRQLHAYGAVVVHIPAIYTTAPPSYAALDAALARLREYDWIGFTSASGVRFTAERLAEQHIVPHDGLRMCKVAAIGAGTERALMQYEVVPALVPPEAVGESLRDALLQAGAGAGTRVLLPQPLEARDVVAAGLRAAGVIVDVVAAYETVTNTKGGDDVCRWLDAPGDKAAIVTSPSTVRGLLAMLDGNREVCARIPLVCIGPVTAAAATDLGFTPALVAEEHSNDGLVAALIEYAEQLKGAPVA